MTKQITKVLAIFIFSSVFLSFALPALAAQDLNVLKPRIQIAIGGTTLIFSSAEPCGISASGAKYYCIGWIGDYIQVVYRYGVGLAAVLAAIMIMAGGFIWLSSAGNPTQIGKGREFIISALLGLILALFSYIILYTINQRLVSLEPVRVLVPAEQKTACCLTPDGPRLYMVSEGDCSKLGEGYSDAGGINQCYSCCVCKTVTYSAAGLFEGPASCYQNISDQECKSKESLNAGAATYGSSSPTQCNYIQGGSCATQQCPRGIGGYSEPGAAGPVPSTPAPANALDYTKYYEGLRLNRYSDQFGNATIGYGHKITGQEVPPIGNTVAAERAEQLFQQDYAAARNDAAALYSNFNQLSEARQAVLTDMAFNLGTGQDGLGGFTELHGAVESNSWEAAAREILESDYAGQVGGRAERNVQIMRTGSW